MAVYCVRHATKRDRDKSLHKAAKGREAGLTHRRSIVRGEATVKEIQGEIGHKIAMRPPTCAGCGGAFDKAGEPPLKIIGMLKYHHDCGPGVKGPGREAAVVPKSPQAVARAAPAQLVLRIHLADPAAQRRPYTFFFVKRAGLALDGGKGFAAAATVLYRAEATRTCKPQKRLKPGDVPPRATARTCVRRRLLSSRARRRRA